MHGCPAAAEMAMKLYSGLNGQHHPADLMVVAFPLPFFSQTGAGNRRCSLQR